MFVLYGDGDLRAALIALIVRNGGKAEVTLEEYGEAVLSQKLGNSAIAIDRTAKGIEIFLTEQPAPTHPNYGMGPGA